ncbi:hypothetical protein A9Q86_02295 [Flavobacteriales bacterium 33_180_T64]|nr:hypothetical protein A9Q86_02295 [Flavobacteriales bacterium 33_180_T64]
MKALKINYSGNVFFHLLFITILFLSFSQGHAQEKYDKTHVTFYEYNEFLGYLGTPYEECFNVSKKIGKSWACAYKNKNKFITYVPKGNNDTSEFKVILKFTKGICTYVYVGMTFVEFTVLDTYNYVDMKVVRKSKNSGYQYKRYSYDGIYNCANCRIDKRYDNDYGIEILNYTSTHWSGGFTRSSHAYLIVGGKNKALKKKLKAIDF